ncbi:MAG: zf-TFIIB domain-containing protein [Candidatus Thermoplasmatota archaeon]|nr:zf-TFIIB domain-containing protein [Candidatus Thermoplasmatota archaeon]
MNESEVYPCPRCSGVNLTKKFALRKKLRHWSCKKCRGIMLSVDDINKLPFIGSRIIKKHNIEKFLGSGDIGTLRCASCSSKMNEIHIVCKKHDKHTSPIVNAGKLIAGGAAFIGITSVVMLLIILTEGVIGGGPSAALGGRPSAKSKKRLEKAAEKTRLKKSEVEIVTIDGCTTCKSFWFDEGELEKLKVAKILKKYSGLSNEELRKFRMKTEKNFTDLVGFASKETKIEWGKISSPKTQKIEWGKISSPKTQKIKAKSLPEGKIVGDIIEKDTPSEGMLILNKKTNKWDFVRNIKNN